MPYRKTSFEQGRPFHIISRAIEGRKIFEREEDCYRFILQVFAASVGKPAFNLWKKDTTKVADSLLQGEDPSAKFVIREHPPLVNILDFSLVINHYHFHLLPSGEKAMPLFMKKLNGGFAKYFNLKYQRKGFLFASRYQSVSVKTEAQLNAVSRYITIINPLDIYQPGWREDGLKNKEGALNFLGNYQFSSFPDRVGKRKSKILAPKEILEEYFSEDNMNKNGYLQFVKDFLEERFSPNRALFLE